MTDRMKRKTLPTLLAAAGLVFGLGTASAQPRPPKNLEWGLSLGFNTAYMDLIAKQAILEFYGELSAEVPLVKGLALCSGLAYSRKGGDGSLPSSGRLTVVTPVSLRVQYLEMPLLIKFIPTPNLYLEGGLYGAVKVGGYLMARGAPDADDLISGTDAGYVLGMGGEFNFLGRRQYTGLRYSHGLSRVLATGNNHLITITYLFGVYF
jgi:hypothetical protein